MKRSAIIEQDSDSDYSIDENDLETSIDVGFVDDQFDELTPEERYHAKLLYRSPFFASKLGGKPSWLNYNQLPQNLKCNSCQTQLSFLLQIYAPITETDKNLNQIENLEESFHRVLFVFLCSDEKCSKRTMKVYRSQLNRINDFYSSEAPPHYDDGFDVAQKYLCSFYEKLKEKNLFSLCTVCGLNATKKCAKCSFCFYCTQAHQVFDWSKANHKELCAKYTNGSLNQIEIFIENENNKQLTDLAPFMFPELEILIEPEVLDFRKDKKKDFKYDEQKLTEDLEQNLNLDQDNDFDNLKENETDKDFEKFKKITSNQSEQILRYERGGQPLWVTKTAKLNETQIPLCSCGSKRTFEFQINPQLLCHLGLDELKQLKTGIDWAGLYIYTCLKSCTNANTSYTEEFIYKQEFVQ